MKGSEKQIEWAEDIKERQIAEIDEKLAKIEKRIARMKQSKSTSERRERRVKFLTEDLMLLNCYKETINEEDSASAIIDNRRLDLSVFLYELSKYYHSEKREETLKNVQRRRVDPEYFGEIEKRTIIKALKKGL